MDLTSGYHQVELSKEARKYFNFILPQGRFRYTSAPMGFVASGDWFNQLTDRVLKGIPGTQKEVDDILGQAVEWTTSHWQHNSGKFYRDAMKTTSPCQRRRWRWGMMCTLQASEWE